MSIADKIQRLQAAKVAIANAITGKGGTVGANDGFEDFAAEITALPPGATLQANKTYSVSASGTAEVTPDTGFDGMEKVIVSTPAGTIGTVSASKSISGNTATIIPSIATGTPGYNAMAAKSGSALTVQASELVSGSETKTGNGTYDVTDLAQIIVAVPTYDGTVE